MNVLIFLGGEKPSIALSNQAAKRAQLIIAADSGFHAVTGTGIIPHVVTGDFDSIGELPDSTRFTVIPAPEQDATDFQKALRHVPKEATSLEILGGTGLRSDHFLTNLLIASSRPPKEAVVFHDDTQSIYRITPDCPMRLNLKPDTVVSLIPFAVCEGVTTTGLHWNLLNEKMGTNALLGQSNRVDQASVSVEIQEGVLYTVVNHPNGFA